MKRLFTLALSFLLATTVFANDIDRSAVDTAYQKWSAASIGNYRFTLTLRENWGAASTALVIVKNGTLKSAGIIIRRNNPIPENEASETSGLRKTIDDLFAEMQSRDDFLPATFDENTGRPIDISYQHPEWEEAENQYEVRDFVVTD